MKDFARPDRTVAGSCLIGAVFALAVGLTGCGGGGAGQALPSSRTATITATNSARPTRSRETEPTTKSATTRATATATRTAEPPPAQQTARTETPPTQQPVHATEQAKTQTQTVASSAVPVSATGDATGYLGWLLLLVLVGGVFIVVVVTRSRRTAAWDAQCSDLTAETGEAVTVDLPPVLAAHAAEERAESWPPVRDDLIDLSGRWVALAGRAPDDARQATADETAILLRDLVPAIDTETRALADGGDWQRLRPEVDAILDALAASAAAAAA